MRKWLITTATILLPIAGAQAADLRVAPSYKAPPIVADQSYWNGFYIGGNVGFGRTDFNASGSGFFCQDSWGTCSADPSANGILGGVQVGYNYQFGYFVLGLESDFQVTGMKTTVNGTETSLPWFGTTRVRGGFLISPALLIYGTGGVAYGQADTNDLGVSMKQYGVGWTAGAGAEWAFGPKGLSIGAEYLHVRFDGINGNSNFGAFASNADADLARVKVNWRF